jgi:hypothetical protein
VASGLILYSHEYIVDFQTTELLFTVSAISLSYSATQCRRLISGVLSGYFLYYKTVLELEII